jgi:hypothetical protein
MAKLDRASRHQIRGCEWLYNHYCQRPARAILLPTLEGLRLSLYYHPVPLSDLNRAFPGEKLAIQWRDRAFLSPLVPGKYARYVLVNFQHRRLSTSLANLHPDLGILPASCGVFLMEASLARYDLEEKAFRDYWAWRRNTGTDEFFPKAMKDLSATERLIERLAPGWARIPMSKGVSSIEELSPFSDTRDSRAFYAREQAMAWMADKPALSVLLS